MWEWLTNNAGNIADVLGSIYGTKQATGSQQNIANQQLAAGQAAAQAARFQPVGITSRFGKSGFTYDNQGRLVGAGYQVAPDMAAMREGLLGLAGGNLRNVQQAASFYPDITQQAKGLFNLGSQYLATSPQQAAQTWMQQQQEMLRPGQETELANIRNRLQQTGRGGLGISQGTGMQATNPEMAAYYNSLAKTNMGLAAQADQYGMDRAKYGAGLLGLAGTTLGMGADIQTKALEPWKAYLGGAQTIEGLGMNALDASRGLGSAASSAGAAAGNALLSGAQQAGQYQNNASTLATAGLTGAINAASPMLSGLFSSGYSMPGTDVYGAPYRGIR